MMTKKEIKDYKVIKPSEVAKKNFDSSLYRYDIIGTFRNEYGELFVIFNIKREFIYPECPPIPNTYCITGDEYGWEGDYVVTKDGSCFSPFLLNAKEIIEIRKILKNND